MNETDKWENVFGPDDAGVTDGKAVQQVHEHDDDQEHEGQQEQVAAKEERCRWRWSRVWLLDAN